MLALWSTCMELYQIEVKEKTSIHGHSQQIKLNNFTVILWVKRRENRNPI